METVRPRPNHAAFATVLLLVTAFVAAPAAAAIGTLWDDFETYTTTLTLAAQSAWECRDGDPGRDAFVVDVLSYSPTQSAAVAPPTCVLHDLGGWTDGRHTLSLMVHVPGDFDSGSADPLAGSYVRLLSVDEPGFPVECSVQMNFDSNDGMLKVYYGNGMNTNHTPYVPDEWSEIQCVVNLTHDRAQVFYNGLLLADYPYSAGATGQGGPLALATLELDGHDASPVYYDAVHMSIQPAGVGGGPRPPLVKIVAPAPNPFNAGTTIRYELREAGEARVTIHDLRGRFVAELVRGFHRDGPHERTWDGRDTGGDRVGSGVYLVSVVAAGERVARRIAFVQ